MPTNKQRRDAQRRHLERQLERRREREVRRRKTNLVISIVGTLVVIAAIVLTVVLISGGDDKTPSGNSTTSKSPTPTSSAPTSPSATPSTSYPPATGAAVTFNGVTVKGAADLKGYPVVTSKESKAPTAVEVKDLVVGKGKAATPTSTVTVQYYGVLYKDGTYFDSSWKRGMPAQFPLTGVVPGFTKGIGGDSATGIAPMKEGGRRIIIVPAKDGYGAQASGAIPANSDLVFIVDLKSIDG